jgi:mono/diheme cytochrome c family protein
MRTAKGSTAVAIAVAAVFVAGVGAPARADMAMLKKAKELKIASVQNCQSCHVDKVPKKGAAAANEMGTWLIGQKKERKAKAVDVSWLKDYKPKAK